MLTTVAPASSDSAVIAGNCLHFILRFISSSFFFLLQFKVSSKPAFPPPTVVVILILLTLAALSFVLCRYLYHNRGDYRTTGELAPGEDPDEEDNNKPAPEKKEYFI